MKRKWIKTITSLAAALMMLGCAFSCSAAVVTDGTNFYSLGDVNTDNRVDIRDLVRMKKHLATGYKLLEAAADIDSNGEIDAADLAAVRKYLIGFAGALEPNNSLWNTEIR